MQQGRKDHSDGNSNDHRAAEIQGTGKDLRQRGGDRATGLRWPDGDGGTDTITDFAGQYYIMNYSKEVSDKVRVLPATKQYRKKENYYYICSISLCYY